MALLTVLVVATSDKPALQNAIGSLKTHGFAFEVLGMGLKWEGWRMRMKLYRDAARRLPPESLIVCMDGYDALAIRDAAEFEKCFRSYGTNIVVAMESFCGGNCEPLTDFWREWPGKVPRKKKYVNAGLVAGVAGSIAQMYSWMLAEGASDDQVGLSRYLLSHRSEWYPDIMEKLLTHKLFGAKVRSSDSAFFAHFPGMVNWADSASAYNTAARKQLGREMAARVSRSGGPQRTAVLGAITAIICLLLLSFWVMPKQKLIG